MNTVIGIDLGTTNSVVATLNEGRPRALPIDGSPVVPSVVLYQEDGTVSTGRPARNLALQWPERTVQSVKRKIGREASIDVAGRAIPPEDVSAEILRALKHGAERELGEVLDKAVITVPAYFDDAQRRATLAAGERAGLEVLRLLNEPTAASLVYERPNAPKTPEIMLVYDLGGGTFDVSVLEVMGEVREVRASTGNSALGGDDFDERLVRRFVDTIRTQHHTDVRSSPAAMARLRRAAEDTKITLSAEPQVEVREEFLAHGDQPLHLELVVTRRELEALIDDLLRSTLELSHRVLDEARLAPGERLTRICLVGGSTRIPRIRQLLATSFDAEIHEEIDPDLAVGLGAAIQSGLLQDQPVERLLVDVAPHSLGIRTTNRRNPWDDNFSPIVRRNTALPTERTEEFYTGIDQQPHVEVEVMQGESPRASRNARVGRFEFPLRPVPVGSPVWIRLAYDLDGVVRVTASQPGGDEKIVQLTVPDSTSTTETDRASKTKSAVVRRARALLESLPQQEDRVVLQAALDGYDNAQDDEAREQAEDELLELFLEYEGR
ncbi:MAG: Hsp70 family protein [Myxococcota bacterium]